MKTRLRLEKNGWIVLLMWLAEMFLLGTDGPQFISLLLFITLVSNSAFCLISNCESILKRQDF